ncbi:MAG TPA: hypothetical protein VEZ89_03095 [Rubrivivax sp.]|nr:hypothetical protein [Rubrivivax sp.]
MGLLQRLNSLVLTRVRERSGEAAVLSVTVEGHQLLLALSNRQHHLLDLRRLTRAVAVKHDVYAGTEIALLLEGDNPSDVVQIPESCVGWPETCAALDSLPGTVPYRQWYPRLLANDSESAVDIFSAASV